MGGALHLARRFFGSLRPGPPSRSDLAWVEGCLTNLEMEIWSRMSHPDQRHSVDVARAVAAEVATRDSSDDPSTVRPWSKLDGWFQSVDDRREVMIRSALLHDSGKNLSGLGTPTRVLATLLRPIVSDDRSRLWASGTGWPLRMSQYWRHAEIGGRALAQVGSHRFVSLWAAEHHLPARAWTLPAELGHILRECDDD